MIFTIENDIELCKQYGITLEQLSYIKIHVRDPKISLKDHSTKVYKLLCEFCKLYGVDITKSISTVQKVRKEYNEKKLNLAKLVKIPLMEKDILLPINITNPDIGPDLVEINPLFISDFNINIEDMPAEVMEVYPHFIQLPGNDRFLAKNTSHQEFGLEYLKYIKNDRELHKKVVEHIIWAKENNKLLLGLRKFIETKHWEALFELRKGGFSVGFDTNVG